ncbi:hypothetical protein AX14_013801 [Amanita brunnescens Koide BX004]|nr:hypothetical protein AX14_013801 [Amanita brunnescens Koide BX004]
MPNVFRPNIACDNVRDVEIFEDMEEAQSDNAWQDVTTSPSEIPEDILEQTVQNNSVEVSDGTDKEYRRLMKSFENWAIKHHPNVERDAVFAPSISPKTPTWICSWIMEHCDTIKIDGTPKDPGEYRRSYTWAMKMRSAMTYGFGRLYERGRTHWTSTDGINWTGNPSISTIVSRYMVALRKRKHQSGENTTMSSRAVTAQDIQAMYIFNEKAYERYQQSMGPASTSSEKEWGRERARRLVHAVIALSFVCLLRIDETLSLRVEDIELQSSESKCISITLQKRKTEQFGGTRPFVLWNFQENESHICPIRALSQWITCSKIKSGYIFRGIRVNKTNEKISENPITSSAFLEFFRNMLIDIGKDPFAYALADSEDM